MILKIFLRYILGYVNISVEGYYIERFINTCISKGILIWNVKREKMNLMHANAGIKDFKRLKEVSQKTKCRMQIEEKKGLPFLMNRYRKRKIFGILLVVIVIAMYGTSRYVWNIQIEGTENISSKDILAKLKEERIKCAEHSNLR